MRAQGKSAVDYCCNVGNGLPISMSLTVAAGYSYNPDKAKAIGIGKIFVQASSNAPEQCEFLVVMDISEQAPITVSRISDREVRFGDWQVSFSPDGKFNVVNSGPYSSDLTPPFFTVRFECTVNF